MIFGGATALAMVVINGAVVPVVSWTLARVGVRVVVYPWALLASAFLAHVLTFRWVERRGWRSIRLDANALAARRVALAALLGAAGVGIPMIALLALGWLRVEPGPPGSSILAAVNVGLFLAPAALWEELMFRGYAFQALQEWWGTAAALAVTSVAFGLIHFANAGASLAAVCVVVLAGLMLGGVLVVMRSLYAAFAAHLAWNWTLAGLAHSAVSGIPFATPDYRIVDAGPDWATGGVWGPEGGAGAALGLLSTTVYLYTRRERRGEGSHD